MVQTGAVMLSAGVLIGYLLWLSYHEAIQLGQVKTRDYALVLATRLDATFRRVESNLRDLAITIPAEAFDPEAVSRYAVQVNSRLSTLRLDFMEVGSIVVADRGGTVLYTTADQAGVSIADRMYFAALRDDSKVQLLFSNVAISRATKKPILSIATGVRDEHGVFLGVVLATIDLPYFESLFRALDVGSEGNIAIYRNDDFTRVVRWPSSDDQLNVQLPLDSPTRAALPIGTKAVTLDLPSAADGVLRVYSYQVLDKYPFFLSVGVSHNQALALWRTRVLQVTVASALVLALLGGLFFRLRRTDAARQQLIDETQASEMRYRTLIESLPDPIMIHRAGIFIYLNPAAARLIGATAGGSYVGRPVLDLVHPEFHRAVLDRVEKLVQRASFTPRAEMRFVRSDGSVLDVDTQATMIVYDGAPAVSVVVHDITARKNAQAAKAELEMQLRESQKMEALGTMAGGIAHDFNNALATILGNADLARQDSVNNAPALESLEEIQKAAARARDLVQQILSFSRRQPINRIPMDTGTVVHEAARLLRRTLPARLSLEVHCAPDVPKVLADATQIEQVVINLATNAM